jgi:N-acetyltransferase
MEPSTLPFNPQPELTGPTLQLRPLRPDDLDALHAAASDPATWAGHPAKERHKREVFEPYFKFLLSSGTTLAVIDRASGAVIGCSRYYVPPDQPDGIAVGFTFLNNAYWGGATNRAMKQLMLGHAFESFPEVWFHIDPTNIRSQKATAKLGAVHAYDATLDLSGTPARWMCFRLRRGDWAAVSAESGAA